MIQPLYLNLSKIISEKLFRIPEYQRHYSWRKEQREDLFNDILSISEYEDRSHFMATFVCLDTKKKVNIGSESYSLMDVVDGQQRMTTLILLLKAIEKKLNHGTEQEKEEAILLKRMLQPSAGQYIILQTNHDNSELFQNYLKTGSLPEEKDIKIKADRKIKNGIKDCEQYVEKWIEKNELIKLLSLIKNNLYFIFQLFEDERAVYTVFEVLNSRGLPVDWLDKCKSMLMGLLFEYSDGKDNAAIQIENAHKTWGKIYREIGLLSIPGIEILTFSATLHDLTITSRTLTEKDSIDYYRKICSTGNHEDNIEKILSVMNWISNVTVLLKEIYRNNQIKAVTQIRHARLLAISIFSRKDVPDSMRKNWIKQWEKVTFRVHSIFRKDSRYSVGDYVRLSQNIIHNNIEIDDVLKQLIALGRDYPIDRGVKYISETDCYNSWQEELRYIFFKYEEHLCKVNNGHLNENTWDSIWNNSPIKSIEHIYPQGEDTYKLQSWKNKIRGKIETIRSYVHRLGNLVLLTPSLNSQAGQKSFLEKKEIYKNANLFQFRDILAKQDWRANDIREREEKIIEWIKQEFDDIAI